MNSLEVIAETASAVTLAVGDVPAQLLGRDCSFVCHDAVTPELLAELMPELIVSSLFDPVTDTYELAGLLARLEFRGRHRAITLALPKPALVRREIVGNAPGLDFDLWIIRDRQACAQDETGFIPARKRAALAR